MHRQLDCPEAQGLFVKKGTLIDATLVKAAAKPPKGDDGALSDVDPEAGWTRKNGVSTYGYKGHIGVDEGTDLIRTASFTSADMHDSVAFEGLVSGDEEAVYADKAYPSEEHRAFLAEAQRLRLLSALRRDEHGKNGVAACGMRAMCAWSPPTGRKLWVKMA